MSTLNVSNISDGTDTVATGYVVNGSTKTWVNYDGTGTPSIRDSLNASSITDHAIGQTSITVSSGFANVNYSVCASCSTESGTNTGKIAMPFTSHTGASPAAPTTTNFRIATVRTGSQDAGEADNPYNLASAFGDLA